jgi:uncharacterized protein
MKRTGLICLFLLLTVALTAGTKELAGRWNGTIKYEAKEWKLEFNFYYNKNGISGSFDLPDYGLYNLELSVVSINDGSFNCEYSDKESKAEFEGKLIEKNIKGTWRGLGINAEFEVNKTAAVPLVYETKEVTFRNNDIQLAGTLILPQGKGPFPGVVLVHTSGNQTRSESFYRSRGFYLASNGFAVLIYDRRGRGASGGRDVSMELLADDVIAGVEFLKSIDKINRMKIGVMGNSQGGYVAPLAAAKSHDIAFLIVVSAPGITPDEQNDFSIKNDLISLKVSADTIESVLRLRGDIRDYQYNQTGEKEDIQNRLNSISSKAWFKSTLLEDSVRVVTNGVKEFLTYNPISAWVKVTVPVLAVWGDSDSRVPVELSKSEITKALLGAGNKDFTQVVFSNSTHGLTRTRNGNEFDWPRLAEGYQELLSSWIKKVTE